MMGKMLIKLRKSVCVADWLHLCVCSKLHECESVGDSNYICVCVCVYVCRWLEKFLKILCYGPELQLCKCNWMNRRVRACVCAVAIFLLHKNFICCLQLFAYIHTYIWYVCACSKLLIPLNLLLGPKSATKKCMCVYVWVVLVRCQLRRLKSISSA